ncbi:MAG TPA: ATP synthase F1 subunit epsilon [Candidatus Saccharimonadales bacterium]|nr:ATP synthase F1 subunit epsilon [Candidatus Saccharimonadales bacterium]
MNFQLISANGVKFDGEAYEVLVPTLGGTIALFEDHMPLISAGAPGVLSVRKKASDHDDQMENFAVYGGVVQIDGKNARFITDDITEPDDVTEAEAQKALERAQHLVANAGSREELNEAKRVQVHHEVRLHLAQLKRRHHG